MMEYNPEYVYFEPTDNMINKWCIAADSVRDIRSILEANDDFIKGQLVQIKEVSKDKSFPFKVTCYDKDEPEVTEILMKFVYIDPAFQDMMNDKKSLKWTDLKIGDVVRSKVNRNIYMQVQGIDETEGTYEHIFFGGRWKSDDDLAEDWEKVDE